MRTNATIKVFPKIKDWKGQVTPGTEVSLTVWLEESTQTRFSNGSQIFYAAGYFITDTDLHFKDYGAIINGTTYDIFSVDRYCNMLGFHHSEVFFK